MLFFMVVYLFVEIIVVLIYKCDFSVLDFSDGYMWFWFDGFLFCIGVFNYNFW